MRLEVKRESITWRAGGLANQGGLERCIFHSPNIPTQRKHLRFVVMGKTYKFNCLPFGLSTAGMCVYNMVYNMVQCIIWYMYVYICMCGRFFLFRNVFKDYIVTSWFLLSLFLQSSLLSVPPPYPGIGPRHRRRAGSPSRLATSTEVNVRQRRDKQGGARENRPAFQIIWRMVLEPWWKMYNRKKNLHTSLCCTLEVETKLWSNGL